LPSSETCTAIYTLQDDTANELAGRFSSPQAKRERKIRGLERDYQGKKMVICIVNSQPTQIAATRFFHYNAHVEPICFPFPGHYEKLDWARCILVYGGERVECNA
jgi:hypothetical protein